MLDFDESVQHALINNVSATDEQADAIHIDEDINEDDYDDDDDDIKEDDESIYYYRDDDYEFDDDDPGSDVVSNTVDSLVSGDRKVVYTIDPGVTGKNQMLKKFVLTEVRTKMFSIYNKVFVL